MTQPKMKKERFEESITALEKIVNKLESEELSLEESLDKFKEGVKLYKDCKDMLSKAEKKISVLTESMKEETLD